MFMGGIAGTEPAGCRSGMQKCTNAHPILLRRRRVFYGVRAGVRPSYDSQLNDKATEQARGQYR